MGMGLCALRRLRCPPRCTRLMASADVMSDVMTRLMTSAVAKNTELLIRTSLGRWTRETLKEQAGQGRAREQAEREATAREAAREAARARDAMEVAAREVHRGCGWGLGWGGGRA